MKRSDNPNICTHCPHTVIDLGRKLFCPCEDCHVGGLIQGQEPFGLTDRVVGPSETKVGPTISTPISEGIGWVDPMHALD